MRITFESTKLIAVGSAAAGVIIGALWYKKYLKNLPPRKWVKVGEIGRLYIYPIKSFKGILLSTFECTSLGGKSDSIRDRSFIVVDKDGKFVTGRDQPKMTQITPIISETVITLTYPSFPEELEIDVNNIKGDKKEVLIWGTVAEGIDCGDKVAAWLSKCILNQDEGLRMLYFGADENGKKVNKTITAYSKMTDVKLQKNDGGSFSDGVSYHLISEASVKELNSRLEDPVSALNFRPNIIIKGDTLIPFEEDTWSWVKIGDTVFRCLGPCTRCLFTTVDPSTGEKSDNMEPLASLRRYRHVRDPEKRKILTSPAMGIYLGLRSKGIISIADEVFIPVK